jgi:hypothetical protein
VVREEFLMLNVLLEIQMLVCHVLKKNEQRHTEFLLQNLQKLEKLKFILKVIQKDPELIIV